MVRRKKKTTTKPKTRKPRKTKSKPKKTTKSKAKTTTKKSTPKKPKVKLNLTPTERKLLEECKEIVKENPKLRNKGLNKIKDLKKRLYYYKVWYYTELNDLTQLKNHRRRCFKGPRCFHIDHVCPISYCFLEGIPPEKCGHITNLRFIKAKDNIDKGHKLTEDAHRALRRLKRL